MSRTEPEQKPPPTARGAPTDARREPRIHRPEMLLIGAAGRNCGKTTLAEELIRREGSAQAIAGAKVTAIHEDRGPCPRGREGCGVCSSLDAPFRLTRERGGLEGKDTTRLLRAGADPVFWLCVRERHLASGAAALLSEVPKGQLLVAESNSLRRAVDPGLFVITRRRGRRSVRASCRAVWDLADEILEFDGERLDPGPEAFSVVDGRWALKRRAAAVVLAGGKSRRMGRDKALLPVGRGTLIEHIIAQLEPHFEEVLISAAEPEKYAFTGRRIIVDRRPDQGPMMAIASVLERSPRELNFVIPCDVPAVPVDLINRLLRAARARADIAVPVTPDGHYEPLVAVYRRGLAPMLQEALEAGVRQVFSVYSRCVTHEEPLGPGELLKNLNTAEDFQRHLDHVSSTDGSH